MASHETSLGRARSRLMRGGQVPGAVSAARTDLSIWAGQRRKPSYEQHRLIHTEPPLKAGQAIRGPHRSAPMELRPTPRKPTGKLLRRCPVRRLEQSGNAHVRCRQLTADDLTPVIARSLGFPAPKSRQARGLHSIRRKAWRSQRMDDSWHS